MTNTEFTELVIVNQSHWFAQKYSVNWHGYLIALEAALVRAGVVP